MFESRSSEVLEGILGADGVEKGRTSPSLKPLRLGVGGLVVVFYLRDVP